MTNVCSRPESTRSFVKKMTFLCCRLSGASFSSPIYKCCAYIWRLHYAHAKRFSFVALEQHFEVGKPSGCVLLLQAESRKRHIQRNI